MNLISRKVKQGKIFVYPKFKARYGDFYLFRLNGSGLGNNLFVWAKYIILMNKYQAIPLCPTWIQFNLTRSKHFISHLVRNNIGLFRSLPSQIGGIRKLVLLISSRKVSASQFEAELAKNPENRKLFEGKVILTSGMNDYFTHLIDHYNLIRSELLNCINNRHKDGLLFDFSNSITVHVRLGDFVPVYNQKDLERSNAARLDINWYKSIIKQIRDSVGYSLNVYVISDGTLRELKPILDMENTQRLSFKSAIADLLALSNSNILITSGSTFSMWASYLGRMPVIWHNGKLKQRIYKEKPEFELECDKSNLLSQDQLSILSKFLVGKHTLQ